MFTSSVPSVRREALRRDLKSSHIESRAVVVPGVHDPLTALCAEDAGAAATFLTGAGSAAAYLGALDVGIMRLHDTVDQCQRVAAVTKRPLIVDADDGYGDAVQTYRTVELLEQAGVSALHIEDQASPKRAPYFASDELPYALIAPEDMAEKIRAACDARVDPNLVIFARCDARRIEGLERTLQRCEMYLEAGADGLFPLPRMTIGGTDAREDLAAYRDAFPGVPMLQASGDGMAPDFPDVPELSALGVSLAVFAVQSLCATVEAMKRSSRFLLDQGSLKGFAAMATYDECNRILGYNEYMDRIRGWKRDNNGANIRD